MLGIDDNWVYTMTDDDLAGVKMEGFESLQPIQISHIGGGGESHVDTDEDCIEPIDT